MDYLKGKIKNKIRNYLISIFSPLLIYLVIFLVILGGATALGSWFTSNNYTEETDNDTWLNRISDDVLSEINITKKQLEKIVDGEDNSYLDNVKRLTVYYLKDTYKPQLDSDGNIMVNDFGSVIYEYDSTEEDDREYLIDESDFSYEFRLPWQLIYAVSLVASLDSDGEQELTEVLIQDNDSMITDKLIKNVTKAFNTKYYFAYDYYNNKKTSYNQIDLNSLPHEGSYKDYNPSLVYTKVETCLYDYVFNNSMSSSDKNKYTRVSMTTVPRKDRFVELLESVGCDESAVELIIEILNQLGNCEDMVNSLETIFDITSLDRPDNSNNGGNIDVIGGLGDVQLTDITSYALQFVGNPYIYGGTSLTNGIDCSAFVQVIYKKFGVNLPRTSREQARVGTTISSIKNALPGDLIFYSKNGVVYHVAMYLGGNKIVHASNSKPYPQGGIKVSNNAQYAWIHVIKRVY